MHYSFTDFTPGKTVVMYHRPSTAVIPAATTSVLPQSTAPALLNDAIKAFGYTLTIMATLGIMGLFAPIAYQEVAYRFGSTSQSVPAVAATKQSFSDLIATPPPVGELEVTQEIPTDESFSIVIPKINVNSKIIPNVSVSDSDQYLAALRQGVAHAKGTYFPGEGGTIFVFGHSTDYFWNIEFMNAQFYLLKELETGDEVVLYYNGKRYIYTVTKKLITDPEDLSVLEPKQDGEKLILQTCWPPGTAWRRYIVEAQPIEIASK